MPETRTPYDSPALTHRSAHYPRKGFGGAEERVPLRVRTTQAVFSDFGGIFGPPLLCFEGAEYDVWVNSHGAVAAILPDGLLGLKPGEFTVVAYHDIPSEEP